MDFHARFGFTQAPFTREWPIDQRFRLPFLDEAVDALTHAIERRESAALFAPAGAGKTTVLRAVRERLPEARFQTSYVKVTALSKRDFCRELALAVGAEPAGT